MNANTHPNDRRKRVVTTEGTPLGWAVRDGDGDLCVEPDGAVVRGCDSWLAPAWDESATFRLDEDAVIGVGHSTVVLAVGSDRARSDRDSRGRSRGSDETAGGTDRKNAEVDP